MKLYKITGEMLSAITLYNLAETDEQLLEVEEKLTGLQTSFNDKAIAVAKHVINTESEVVQIEAEIARLSEQKKRRDKQSEWFRGYLKNAMEATNTQEIDGVTLKLKIKKNPPAVNVLDEAQVPAQYKREKVVITLDKEAIKQSWKEGIGVAGTEVKQGTRLEIR